MTKPDVLMSGVTATSLWSVFSQVAPIALSIVAGVLCVAYWGFKVSLVYREWRNKSKP